MNNWIVGNLQASFDTWNEKLTEIWSLVTTTPQVFRGGEIWNTIVTINDGLKAFGYGLLVLFFAMSVFHSAASFRDLQRPEFALRHFIRFIIAKVAVGSAMEIMTAVFSVCGGVVQSIMGCIGGMSAASVTLPQEIADAIEEVGFFQSVPLWMVTFLGSLFITVLSFILIMTVYGRFFRLYMFTALAPLPLASFAGEDTSFIGKAFLKSYLGVCMEGAIVVLACLIFSAFAASGAPIADTSLPVVTMSWQYVAQTICNRKKLLNPHGFVLGVSGSGKSFSMKEAITFIALSTNDDIIMIDAEREYGELTRALQGAVLEISPSSPHHINPLDINRGYGAGENPVAMKSELMMSICEQQMGVGQLGAFHKSIIDRCTANIYHDFIKSGGEGRIPTLPDWRNEVKRQPEREAQELALASELFVEGSLNMFAHETNFDIDNRIVCFDLYEMGEQLKPTALNVVLETIQNRVAANRLAGRYTWVFVDEVYLFFKYYYSAQFLYKCWKRFRKYAAAMTAATQNIEECLRSETARLMLANSEFLILLNQAATDRAELAKLLHISETQMSHVTNVEAGHGLMRIGSSIIPFVNEFPRDGTLYRLMTTTPGDK